MTTDDSMSDDVFEDELEKPNYLNDNHKYAVDSNLTTISQASIQATPSPTGYPGYKPPKEALRLYALENEYFQEQKNTTDHKNTDDNNDIDGWKSYNIEEDNGFDESIIHKVNYNYDSFLLHQLCDFYFRCCCNTFLFNILIVIIFTVSFLFCLFFFYFHMDGFYIKKKHIYIDNIAG